MKKIILASILAFSLAGCANFKSKLAEITGDIVAVNQAISDVSKSLAANCNQLHDIAASIQALTGVFTTNSKVVGSITAANAALDTYCTAPPSDIASAINVVAAQVVAAKTAYKSVKNGS